MSADFPGPGITTITIMMAMTVTTIMTTTMVLPDLPTTMVVAAVAARWMGDVRKSTLRQASAQSARTGWIDASAPCWSATRHHPVESRQAGRSSPA